MKYKLTHPEVINAERNRLGMSVDFAAQLADMSRQQWARLEYGQASYIEGPFFRAVADALEIDPSEIVDDYERPKLMVARVYPRMEMIRDYLNRTRLNVNALARNANVPPGIIRNILDRGGRSCSTAVALKLAKAIGVEPEEFCPALAGLEIEDDGE